MSCLVSWIVLVWLLTLHTTIKSTVHKIVDMLQFINPKLRKKSKKMLTRQLSEARNRSWPFNPENHQHNE